MLHVSRLAIGLTVLGLASAGCEAAEDAGVDVPVAADAAGSSDAAGAADAAASDVVALDSTQPDTTEPDTAASDASVSDTMEPDAPLDDAPEPDVTEPDAPEPDVTEPDVTEPDVTEPDAGLPTGAAQLGANGGALTSADGKASVAVPPGVLELPTNFAISLVADPPGDATFVSDVYDFAPDGASFAVPLTLCLSVDEAKIAAIDACLMYFDSATATWTCVDSPLYKPAEGKRCGLTNHFTPFAVGKGQKKSGGQAKLTVVKVVKDYALPGGGVLGVPEGTVAEPLEVYAEVLDPPPASGSVGSPVVALSPQDAALVKPVRLCLPVDPKVYEQKGGCLAALDTSSNPPQWVCEDPCLTKLGNTLVCGETDHLRTFAVVMGQGGDTATCAPKTPIGPEGGVVVSADGAGLLHVPAGALEKTLPFVVVPSASPVDAKLGSAVVSITPSGTKFAEPATVCLRQLAGIAPGDGCLGFLDESSQPPVWKCEDNCLKKGGGDYVCGKTNHLTSFAILLGGSSGSDKCDSGGDYVVGSSGGVWLLAEGAGMVQFPAGAVQADTALQLATVSKPVAPQLLGSVAVDISLADGKQPQVPLTVCLAVSELAQQKGGCLAYLDTSGAEPVWKCEDECLTQISPSFWCGTTDHLTNFAILLGSGQSKDVCEAQASPGLISAATGGMFVAGDGGVTLTVPAGALAKDTVFAIAKSGLKTEPALSPAWDIGPEGLTLAKPATLCIKPLQPLQVGDGLCLASADATGKWQCEYPCLSVNTDGLVCGTTDHFSTWAIAKVSGVACK